MFFELDVNLKSNKYSQLILEASPEELQKIVSEKEEQLIKEWSTDEGKTQISRLPKKIVWIAKQMGNQSLKQFATFDPIRLAIRV